VSADPVAPAALRIPVCRQCGRPAFPPPRACPNCGAADWEERPAGTGAVEQLTTLRRVAGAAVERPVRLASVRLGAGPVLIARAGEGVEVGSAVAIVTLADGALEARPTEER
jgi:uncharacterized OB-fold protein